LSNNVQLAISSPLIVVMLHRLNKNRLDRTESLHIIDKVFMIYGEMFHAYSQQFISYCRFKTRFFLFETLRSLFSAHVFLCLQRAARQNPCAPTITPPPSPPKTRRLTAIERNIKICNRLYHAVNFYKISMKKRS